MNTVIFLTLIIGIYFFSRLAFRELFWFLRKIFRSERLVLSLVTLIMLPGTIVHEMSHFLAATLLFLPVRSITVFPTFEENEIKLGEVQFVKKDFIRSAIVGLAPFFFGVVILCAIFYYHIFPTNNLGYNVLLAYGIFSISSNMFSSPQDLKDTIFLIPIGFLFAIAFYVFGLKVDTTLLNAIMREADYYLFPVLAINLISYLLLKLINIVSKK